MDNFYFETGAFIIVVFCLISYCVKNIKVVIHDIFEGGM